MSYYSVVYQLLQATQHAILNDAFRGMGSEQSPNKH